MIADVAALVAMGERFRTNSQYSTMLGRDDAAATALAASMVSNDGHAILVAEIVNAVTDELDRQIVGMLGLATYQHPMSGEFVAGELFWWVDPAYRGNVGVRLLNRAENWVKSRGARRLYMIAPNEDVERLYSRLGYQRVEVSYQKEV